MKSVRHTDETIMTIFLQSPPLHPTLCLKVRKILEQKYCYKKCPKKPPDIEWEWKLQKSCSRKFTNILLESQKQNVLIESFM